VNTAADRLSSDALRTAFVDAPVAIGVCDEDGRFVAVNASLARLLRRPGDQIVGRPFLAFVHPAERLASLAAYFEAVVAVAAGTRSGSKRLRCLAGDDAVITAVVRWTVTRPDDLGDQYGILYVSEDTYRLTSHIPEK
jgi:PAS domain S-box-containing protein